MKQILCLDFDGVIHSYASGWKGASVIPDPPVPGALEFIVAALDHFAVNIHSSRSHQWGGRRAMKRYILTNLVRLGEDFDTTPGWWSDRICRTAFVDTWEDEVLWAAKRVVAEIQWPLFKPPAMVSIDDRAIRFTGEFPGIDDLKSFRPWNKPR